MIPIIHFSTVRIASSRLHQTCHGDHAASHQGVSPPSTAGYSAERGREEPPFSPGHDGRPRRSKPMPDETNRTGRRPLFPITPLIQWPEPFARRPPGWAERHPDMERPEAAFGAGGPSICQGPAYQRRCPSPPEQGNAPPARIREFLSRRQVRWHQPEGEQQGEAWPKVPAMNE